MKPLLCLVVGARPNFVKAAPVIKAALATGKFETLTVHTGQHYDDALSDLFFRDLTMPPADLALAVGSGSHAVQTAEVMLRLEPVLLEHKPACVLVFGDINSTVAAAITATKLGIRVAHVESGLRSGDRSMPEEINRILTDSVSDLLFTTEASAGVNLRREGVPDGKVHFVGNTMIDTLFAHLEQARARLPELRRLHGLGRDPYGVLTLHRPSNVDGADQLASMLGAISRIARDLPLVFPVHPRTRARFDEFAGVSELLDGSPGLRLLEPAGYLDFLALVDGARLVLTDSGGIQEETTALGVPCLTLRENTERPITIEAGSNRLAGTDARVIVTLAGDELARNLDRSQNVPPPLWDGRAAGRLVQVLEDELVSDR